MGREVIIGFDSAWTDNLKNPGAVAGMVFDGKRRPIFLPPRLSTFAQASEFVQRECESAAYSLIAVDQPTIVANESGCRPVERVAASVISKLGGGVQPARRGGGGAVMFGEHAPIWRFIQKARVVQNPFEAQSAESGRYLIEVFPALALPSLIPEIWHRGRAAKYNPAARLFQKADWPLVCNGIADFFGKLGSVDAAVFARVLGQISTPRKSDQDCLDSIICLAIALLLRKKGDLQSLVLGDSEHGYIVTPVTTEIHEHLRLAARRAGLPINRPWEGDARLDDLAPTSYSRADLDAVPVEVISKEPHLREAKQVSDKTTGQPAKIGASELRRFLVQRAIERRCVTYGEVARAFGFVWTQGFGASLKSALNLINSENAKWGEPMLMCLVVNQTSRIPGDGFFNQIGEESADIPRRRELLTTEIERCATWNWDR